MKTIGYGETGPMAPNANSDGSDNPEGRQKTGTGKKIKNTAQFPGKFQAGMKDLEKGLSQKI